MNKLKSLVNSVNQFVNRNFPRGSNGRFIFFSVLSIMLVSTLLWGSTYSLFVSSNIDNELNVYKTGNLDVTYTLSSDNVTFDSNKTYSEDEVTSIKPYRITVTNNGNVPYKFNVRLNDETASNSIDSKYIMTQVGKLSFNRLSDCTDNIIKSDIVVLAGTSVDIDVRVWLSEDTSNEEVGKSFFGSLTVDGIAVYNNNKSIDNSNLIAIYEVNASEYIMSLYNGDAANTVHIAGDSSKPQVSLDSTSSIMLDNNGEYRYYGSSPNNYVEYNDELWRIISVSNVKSSEEDTEGEQRVRIIKDTSIGDYAWDSDEDYNNNWADATLMCQLNTMYYNDSITTCTGKTLTSLTTSLNTEARSLIDNALWYLGGGKNFFAYADDFYNTERGTTVVNSSYPCRWTGKVGIMYPSDYAYATDLSVCTSYNDYEVNSNCIDTNWLYSNDNNWLITPHSDYDGHVWHLYEEGLVYYCDVGEFAGNTSGVRPLAILKSDVVIIGGKGTDEEPYQISLKGANDNVQTEVEAFGLAKDIIDLYNDGSEITTVNIGGDSSKPQVHLNSAQSIMLDNNGEYRYYGASPNNYVDFNGELWRIISVSKVFSSENDTTGETRVRIIKDTSIGDYAWDSDEDYNNNWADATLMCQLNTLYYNDTVPACTGKSLDSLTTSLNAAASSLIDNALWYLGGGDDSNLYADDYYTMERGTAVADSSYPYRWTGKVGIMYPSDYAYAADLSVCKVTGYNYDTDTTNCTGTDWLFNDDYQWLMSPYSGSSYDAWRVDWSGYVYYTFDFHVGYESGVRPLAVLKSDVTKLEGEGTSGNPYKLGLGT